MLKHLIIISILITALLASGCSSKPANKQFSYLPGYLENAREIQALDRELIENESHNYAGMYRSKSVCYCLTALFKEDGSKVLQKYTTNPAIEYGDAAYSLNELKMIVADTKQKLEFLGSGLDSVDVNIRNNGVDVSIQGNTMTLEQAKSRISSANITLHPIVSLADVYWDEV